VSEYKIKDNSFTAKIATVDTKATGNPSGHLTARSGEYVVSFPFDCGGPFSGHPFSIVVPGPVFHEHFEEMNAAKKSKKDGE